MNSPTPTRAPALYLLPGLITGLCIAKTHQAPVSLLLPCALVALLASLWCNQHKQLTRLWLCCFFIGTTLSFWAYGLERFPAKPHPTTLALPEREATLTFRVERVLGSMTVYRNSTGIAKVSEATPTSPVLAKSRIYFRVKSPEQSDYMLRRGQTLKLTGILRPILIEDGEDSFAAYLKSIGIHYTFERTSELRVLKEASAFDRFCMRMNERFDEYLRLGAPANTHLTNVYVAMLLGKKAALSDEQTERFRMTGTMHFFAISGLHIGVIATVIAQFLLLLRVPRHFSPWVGLPLLYLYVEITGASPSAVRAFLMAACFWLSYALTRQRSPLAALASSAVAVLWIAPEQVWSLGFQLSYTVVLSILLFGLPLHEVLTKRFHPNQFLPEADWSQSQRSRAWITDKLLLLFSISIAAWLASAPLSAGLFGFIAPGAIWLNMLLIYLAALVITGGVISLSVAAIGFTPLCAFMNHSSWVCISIMEWLIQLNLSIPGSAINSDGFPKTISYIGVIGFIGLVFWLHLNRLRFRSLAILIPPVYVIFTLLLGLIYSP